MRQKQIKGLSLNELTSLCEANNITAFRAKQIYHWMYRHGALDILDMNNLPDDLLKYLKNNFTIKTLEIERIQNSNVEDTKKILFKTTGNSII